MNWNVTYLFNEFTIKFESNGIKFMYKRNTQNIFAFLEFVF